MNKRTIAIHIANKNRPTELALLLQSLRTQTYQDFNVYILDDASGTPIQHYYFLKYIIQRMKIEGHNVKIIRNDISSGVSKARQQLVDYTMEKGNEEYICRIDDDSICKEDMLEKLMEGIDKGYDLIGCVVPTFVGPDIKRETKFIKPIIGEARYDKKGNLIYMADDCGFDYMESEIIPTAHFRSTCLYKRELHDKGVDYKSRLSKNGFLEEAIFSFKAILKGFKLAIHTGAKNYHLVAPSGGERDTMNMVDFNKKIFLKTAKKMYQDHGDFLTKYYKKLGIDISKIKLNKNYQMNLIK